MTSFFGLVKMESEDEGVGPPEDFVETLRDMMRSWRWPEWQIDQELHKFLKVCEGVGIVKATERGYEPTALVTSPQAWDTVKKLLEEMGMLGGQGS